MANETISDAIQYQINHSIAEQVIKPQLVTITDIYDDDNHIDVITGNEETYEYIPTIASNLEVGNIGLLFFLENNQKIVITK